MLQKAPAGRPPQSLREIARTAGRSSANASKLARAGLLPGYEGSSQGWVGAKVPAELAAPFGTVLRYGTSIRGLAGLLRTDPDAVEEFATALLQLVAQRRQTSPPAGQQEEAA